MTRQRIDASYLGKKAFKKTGMFGGLVGVVDKLDNPVHNIEFCVRFRGGGSVAIVWDTDIEIVEERVG